jgi:hypothetical protein
MKKDEIENDNTKYNLSQMINDSWALYLIIQHLESYGLGASSLE